MFITVRNRLDSPVVVDSTGHLLGGGEYASVTDSTPEVVAAVARNALAVLVDPGDLTGLPAAMIVAVNATRAANGGGVPASPVPTAPTGVRARGPWTAATFYQAGDVTTYQGGTYRALANHTSPSSFDIATWETWAPPSGTYDAAGAAASAATVVAESHAGASVSNNTATEANLVAFTLPSDMAAGDVYEFRAAGSMAHTLSTTASLILRFRLGATYAMITPTITLPASISDPRRYTLRVVIHIGDAGAATMYGELLVGDAALSTAWNPTTISVVGNATAAGLSPGDTVAFTGQIFTAFGYVSASSAVLRRVGRAAAVSHLFNGATRTVNGISYTLGSPSKPWSATTRGGATVDRFEVRSGDYQASDGSTKERVEWGQGGSLFAPGQDIWVSYAIKIEAGVTSTAPYCVLGQLHQSSDVGDLANLSPSFEMDLIGADLIAYTRSDPAATTTTFPTAVTRWTLSNFTRDAWHYFVHRMVVDPTGAAGVLQSWHNGASIFSNTAMPLGYNDTLGHYWKHGIYRGAAAETLAVHYANFEISTSSLAARVTSPLTIVSP